MPTLGTKLARLEVASNEQWSYISLEIHYTKYISLLTIVKQLQYLLPGIETLYIDKQVR